MVAGEQTGWALVDGGDGIAIGEDGDDGLDLGRKLGGACSGFGAGSNERLELVG